WRIPCEARVHPDCALSGRISRRRRGPPCISVGAPRHISRRSYSRVAIDNAGTSRAVGNSRRRGNLRTQDQANKRDRAAGARPKGEKTSEGICNPLRRILERRSLLSVRGGKRPSRISPTL